MEVELFFECASEVEIDERLSSGAHHGFGGEEDFGEGVVFEHGEIVVVAEGEMAFFASRGGWAADAAEEAGELAGCLQRRVIFVDEGADAGALCVVDGVEFGARDAFGCDAVAAVAVPAWGG